MTLVSSRALLSKKKKSILSEEHRRTSATLTLFLSSRLAPLSFRGMHLVSDHFDALGMLTFKP